MACTDSNKATSADDAQNALAPPSQIRTPSEPVLMGGCHCGHVTYSSSIMPTGLVNCHCKTCRKLSGGPFLTFASFPTASITWTSGPESLTKTSYSVEAQRAHCKECGSPIYMQYNFQLDRVGLTASTIDESSCKSPLPKPYAHIFIAKEEKAGWYDLPNDKTPKFARFDDGFQEKIDAWKSAMNNSRRD